MRKKMYEQEIQKEQEAKQRVKDDLMEALVRKLDFFVKIILIFYVRILSLASFRW
jgi:hypothetical protein